MREHGVLKRVLLVYGEALRRLDAKEDLPPEALAESAGIIRNFIEDYHERLEENFLFPRFRKANTLVDLVDVLEAQHRAGRRVTDATMRLSNLKAIRDPEQRRLLADSLRAFVRMYAPHEAREDTVLFPALHRIVSAHEYDALGEQFEDESIGSSARTGSRKWSSASPASRSGWASTTSPSSRRRRERLPWDRGAWKELRAARTCASQAARTPNGTSTAEHSLGDFRHGFRASNGCPGAASSDPA